MITRASASWRWPTLWGALLVMLVSQSRAQTLPVADDKPAAVKMELLPSDFLDNVGQQMKARWRQLYRDPPPTPSTERLRVAFTLGGLIADSYLALQAGDAQQFKNNSQDLLKYSRVLGLAEKVTPDVMAGSKMAETEDWPALRKQVLQTQQRIDALLIEQRDEDLAVLVSLGMWIRLFDITTSLVVAETALQNKTLCIGSIPFLNELVARYERLTEATRTNESVAIIGNVLVQLQRHWTTSEGQPSQDVVQMTHDKLKFVIGKLALK